MSKRLVITCVASAIICIILWMCLSRDDAALDALKCDASVKPDAAINRDMESMPLAQVTKDVDTSKSPAPAPQLQEPDPAEAQPQSGMETDQAAQKHLDDYLIKHDRDARSLLQAFRVSKNKEYLTEALERHPNDPMVLFHCVLYDTNPTEERKSLLLKLQELLPDDAVPCYLFGEQLLREGDREGALELLIAGSLKPYANNYANEMISDDQEFLVATGHTPGDALGLASFNVELRLLTPMRQLIGMIQDIHTDISAGGDGDNSAGTWAIAGSRLAQSMHKQMSQTLNENLMSVAVEKQFLSLLPPETELAAGGMTVAQRIKEIGELRALVDSFELMADAGLELPPEEKLAFFKKFQEEGELAALLWLNGRNQKKEAEIPTK